MVKLLYDKSKEQRHGFFCAGQHTAGLHTPVAHFLFLSHHVSAFEELGGIKALPAPWLLCVKGSIEELLRKSEYQLVTKSCHAENITQYPS